ncbi:MAG TPA: caspase family protein [Candidatus Coprenecus avistercoris]|uniref:Caspase family protein n=1 Tax=Candidatus Coprenecus avistercoris TaxID=2840730 RepID=A0A9D1J698_9BACT|nr:caspase family protein [Candidatus Coprenecus avistercoris]
MKHILLLTLSVLMTAGTGLYGQDSQSVLAKANQQYVLYENAKGDNSAEMYDHLYQSYTLYVSLLDAYSDPNAMDAARARLLQIYPALKNAAMFFSNMNDSQMAYKFGIAYIKLPKNPTLTSEPLFKDELYPQIVYNTGISAYKLQNIDDAILCFNEYLATGEAARAKDCIVFLNMIYLSRHNYVEQEKILKRAIAEYPNTLDFYYNLINLYISTQNQAELMATIDKVLQVDPNDVNVLPIKARMEEASGNVEGALGIYKKLLSFFPDDLAIMKGIAKCSFKIGSEINNQAYAVVDEAQGMELKQKAYPYLFDARTYFEKILRREPDSQVYMKGLEECYKFMDMTAESTVLMSIIAEGGSFDSFDKRLQDYNQLAQSIGAVDTVGTTAVFGGDPPVLTTLITGFTETNSNKVIDAGESFSVDISIQNSGLGDAHNVKVLLSENSGMDRYFEGSREIDAGIIKAGETKSFTFRYTLSETAPTAKANIIVYTLEENGMDADPSSLVVNIQEMARPRLLIADYQYMSARGTSITLGDRGQLIVAVQNAGRLPARNAKITFECPTNIIATDEVEIAVDSIQPGEVIPLSFDFLVNKRFDLDSIPIAVKITEGSTFAVVQDVFKVKLGEYLSTANKIVIEGKLDAQPVIDTDFSLAMESELLENVPAGISHPNRYALIIGNEDYSRVGGGAEINVPFACNDAIVFKEYCVRTFGIPDDHIRYIDNATAGLMRESIDWLINVGKANPNSEIFFFYSGHGSNDEASREPYLLPVDVSGKYIKLGIPLNDLYAKLSGVPCQGAYVFLDACFSGGYKSKDPIVAQKGVRVVPKYSMLGGKLISFSSSSGEQTSSVYYDKRQGYFTYYLLKTIQDAKGNISLGDLYKKTKEQVEAATAVSGKLQTPQVLVSPDWTDWNTKVLK